jgi:hypothetical protein
MAKNKITREEYHRALIREGYKKKHLTEMLEEFDKWNEEETEIHKRMNDINTFQAYENEVCLRGTDEFGKDFTVWWDSYDFLDWIDSKQLKYIKEKLIKHIKEK